MGLGITFKQQSKETQSGSAILMVMVLGLFISSLSYLSLRKYQIHLGSQKTAEARQTLHMIHTDIRGVLGDTQSCTETIKKIAISEVSSKLLPFIKGSGGQILYRVNRPDSTGTTITELQLSKLTPIPGTTSSMAELSIFFERKNSTGLELPSFRARDIKIKIDHPPLNVTQLALGKYHTCALFTNGRMKCWGGGSGGNNKGQLGYENKDTIGDIVDELGGNLPFVDLGSGINGPYKATAISAGNQHTCALLNVEGTGRVKCWGNNAAGQLGYGNIFSKGDQEHDMTNLPFIDLGGIIDGHHFSVLAIASGDSHNCAIIVDPPRAPPERAWEERKVKCWGENEHGQLGRGNTEDRGDEGGEMRNALDFIQLGQGGGQQLEVVAISAGISHSCAILNTTQGKQIKCWGSNSAGQLGAGSTASKRGALANEMGSFLNFINLGTISGGTDPLHVLSMSTGGETSCAVLDISTGSRLKCWGYNSKGQLGIGNSNSKGQSPNHMGNYISSSVGLPFVDLGTNLVAKSVSVGNKHTCVTLTSGKVKCWGEGGDGRLGLGSGGVSDPIGNRANEMGYYLKYSKLGTDASTGERHRASDVFAGFVHTCAVMSEKVKCWGEGGDRALGYGNNQSIARFNAGEMGNNLGFALIGSEKICTAIFAEDGENWEYKDGSIFLGDDSTKLGIGTDEPEEMLHVKGTMKIEGDASAENVFSSGSIQLDEFTGSDCTDTEKGTQRFRGYEMEYCDGTDWRNLGQSLWEEHPNQIATPATGTPRNVGIGTDNPQARLHVAGESKLENGEFTVDGNSASPSSIPKALAIGGNVGVGGDATGAENTGTDYRLKIEDGNFVSTGFTKMDHMKLKATTAPECSPAKGLNTLYYNIAINSLQYCDGNIWRSFRVAP